MIKSPPRVPLIMIILVCAIQSFSQSQYNVKAVVVDKMDSTLFGNVLVLSSQDSSFITGSYFMDGNVSVDRSTKESFLMKIISTGFRDSIFPVAFEEGEELIDLGSIRLNGLETQLGELVISANIPLFEPSTDGTLKVNVQKTMLASSSSVREVLSKSPGVLVGENGVSVVGKGEALLYLNGKRITIERLGTIPVNQIKNIEVITNPSAKYDAQGKAVINIITVVNHSEGVQVMLVQNLTMAKHFLSSSAANLHYRKKKWSLTGDYGVSFGKDWNQRNSVRLLNTEGGLYTSDNQNEENTRLTYVSNFRAGCEYRISEKSDVSLQWDGLYNIFDLDVDGDNAMTSPLGELTRLETFNDGQTKNLNNSISLNYNSQLDTLGSTLFLGGQLSTFSTRLFDLIDEEISVENVITSKALRRNSGQNDIGLLTGQVDYTKTFKNSSRLELGGKYADVQNHGTIDFSSKAEGEDTFTSYSEFSNDFEYNEKIPAIYGQYFGRIKKLDYSIGVRSEYTMAQGISNVTSETVIDTNYLNIFPNVRVSGKIRDNWSVSYAYSERISRPQYQALDPFVWYQDSLTSVQGNPNLLPELTQANEGIIGFKKYSLKFGYSSSTNSSRFIVEPGNTGINSIVMKQANIQKLHSYYSTLSIPLAYKKWSSFNTLSLTYKQIEDDRPEFMVSEIVPQFYFYSFNQFKLKKKLKIEISGEYVGEQNDGIYQVDPTYSVTLGLSKTFMKGNLICRFMANDILKSYKEVGSYQIGNTTVNYDRKLNTNFYRFSAIYYFGKLWKVKYKNKLVGNDEFSRIKQ